MVGIEESGSPQLKKLVDASKAQATEGLVFPMLRCSNRSRMASSCGGAQLKVKFGESTETVRAVPCRYGRGCWRPLCPVRHSAANRAARWARIWCFLTEQEVLEVVENTLQERFSDNLLEQTVDVPVSQVSNSQCLLVKLGLLGRRD